MAQFAALICAVSGHRHVREGADICGRERENRPIRELHIDLNSIPKIFFFIVEGICEQKWCHLKPPMNNPPPTSLQLLLSSQQQLLCSCCYAVCNEHYRVCSPRADVIHSGDGVLCLCHLDVSNSGSSGICITVLYCIKQQCLDFYDIICC